MEQSEKPFISFEALQWTHVRCVQKSQRHARGFESRVMGFWHEPHLRTPDMEGFKGMVWKWKGSKG